MAFQEFTLVNPENYCEVMVDIDTDSGKVIDLYYYANDVPSYENEETGKKYSLLYGKTGKNPLFAHAASKKTSFIRLLRNGYIFCMNEEESSYNNDVALIEKSLSLHNIGQLNCY